MSERHIEGACGGRAFRLLRPFPFRPREAMPQPLSLNALALACVVGACGRGRARNGPWGGCAREGGRG